MPSPEITVVRPRPMVAECVGLSVSQRPSATPRRLRPASTVVKLSAPRTAPRPAGSAGLIALMRPRLAEDMSLAGLLPPLATSVTMGAGRMLHLVVAMLKISPVWAAQGSARPNVLCDLTVKTASLGGLVQLLGNHILSSSVHAGDALGRCERASHDLWQPLRIRSG